MIFSAPPFYTTYVKQPAYPPASSVQTNHKLWPWFPHALGAIDGSHIIAHPRGPNRHLYRNWKGFFSMNCLFACTSDFLFTYGLTGWEGSVSDAKLYTSAIRNHGLSIPDGCYYLADAGFPLCKELLVPFRGIRHHLAEWGRASARYFSLAILKFLSDSMVGLKHLRNYSIYGMPRPETSLSAYLVLSRSVSASFV